MNKLTRTAFGVSIGITVIASPGPKNDLCLWISGQKTVKTGGKRTKQKGGNFDKSKVAPARA